MTDRVSVGVCGPCYHQGPWEICPGDLATRELVLPLAGQTIRRAFLHGKTGSNGVGTEQLVHDARINVPLLPCLHNGRAGPTLSRAALTPHYACRRAGPDPLLKGSVPVEVQADQLSYHPDLHLGL